MHCPLCSLQGNSQSEGLNDTEVLYAQVQASLRSHRRSFQGDPVRMSQPPPQPIQQQQQQQPPIPKPQPPPQPRSQQPEPQVMATVSCYCQ